MSTIAPYGQKFTAQTWSEDRQNFNILSD